MWCAIRRPPYGVCLFLSLFAVSRRFSLQPSCHLAVVVVARTASAFLARSAEGEAPSYGSNAAALSLYSQQRWRRVLTRVLVPTCFASTCCHGASAPRAMIQSPPPALFLAMFMAQS